MSFNPRAREGRDGHQRPAILLQGSFNPRAREGRDRGVAWCTSDRACFNPRAREGRDTLIGGLFQGGLPVSIHAPARGATVYG